MKSVATNRVALWAVVAGLSLMLASCCCMKCCKKEVEEQSAGEAGEGWVSIFNGKDLTGWEIMGPAKDAFYAEDGVLVCNGKGGEWIRYTEKLDNFVLQLEYKVTRRANSGVFLRSQEKGHPAYTGFEVQILDDYGHPANTHVSGAIYDVVAATENMSKPTGEWNKLEITCDGPKVIVALNGTKVIDINLDEFTKPIGKFKTPYAELPRTGYIGLQDHGFPLWFRNIRLKKLP
jgi:hypothetical protein